jgi:hypothetical protein
MEYIKNISRDCQVVKGYLRNAIYDLTRQKYYLIQKFSDINQLDKDILDFLEKEEVILSIPQSLKNHFPFIDFTYHTNQIISSCQIKYFGSFDITKITNLNCRDFSIIADNFSQQKEAINSILKTLSNEPVNSVQLHITDNIFSELDFEYLKDIILNYSFCVAYVYFDYSLKQKEQILNILFLEKKANDIRENFYINIKSFTEAQNKNLFYNQFLFIDDEGTIKNSPYSSIDFGYIFDVNHLQLREIVSSKTFNYLWDISKNEIDICKDCEFRYMCCDDKLPITRNQNHWYHKQECNYNPYICKWKGEDGYHNLVECGVISNEHEFSIDHDKIAEINKELWEELSN